MDREKMKKLNLTPIEDLIDEDFGLEGTPERLEFDAGVDGKRLRICVGLEKIKPVA